MILNSISGKAPCVSIRRLRAGWTAEFEAWSRRSLADREVVYVWADGIYVKAGLLAFTFLAVLLATTSCSESSPSAPAAPLAP